VLSADHSKKCRKESQKIATKYFYYTSWFSFSLHFKTERKKTEGENFKMIVSIFMSTYHIWIELIEFLRYLLTKIWRYWLLQCGLRTSTTSLLKEKKKCITLYIS
jgi:hypothetical protein